MKVRVGDDVLQRVQCKRVQKGALRYTRGSGA